MAVDALENWDFPQPFPAPVFHGRAFAGASETGGPRNVVAHDISRITGWGICENHELFKILRLVLILLKSTIHPAIGLARLLL
jgi:hypothetical protein